ncbi:hypothetical protein [Cellulomonas sp. KRMCY2]|uniref:hypothetical protein n=1 Tax=Cellulomonas sp. KRMCY2 TaxID=1304865 RepID=UPI0004BBE04B|nr:hypothetical protein [Cellulomonas sp. KRMCY2]
MRVLSGAAVVGVTLVVLATAGCTDSAGPGPEPSPDDRANAGITRLDQPDAGPIAVSWADGTPVDPTAVDVAAARSAVEGVDYDPVLQTPAGLNMFTLALTPGGDLVSVMIPEGQYDGGDVILKSSQLGTYDGEFVRWPSTADLIPDDNPRQIFAATEDEGTVTWAETASIALDSSNWRIFAREDGGEPVLVAASEEVYPGRMPILTGDVAPLVHDGRVYWATPAPSAADGASFHMQVMSRPADGSGSLTVEAQGVAQPAVNDHGLYVARTLRDDPTLAGGTATVEIVDGAGGSLPVLVVAGDQGVTIVSLVADRERIAFVAIGPGVTGGTVYVVDPVAGAVTAVATPDSAFLPALALCGDRLVMTSADGSGAGDEPVYVLDVPSSDLARVDVPLNYSEVKCAGDMIAWRTLPDLQGTALTTVVSWNAESP